MREAAIASGEEQSAAAADAVERIEARRLPDVVDDEEAGAIGQQDLEVCLSDVGVGVCRILLAEPVSQGGLEFRQVGPLPGGYAQNAVTVFLLDGLVVACDDRERGLARTAHSNDGHRPTPRVRLLGQQ